MSSTSPTTCWSTTPRRSTRRSRTSRPSRWRSPTTPGVDEALGEPRRSRQDDRARSPAQAQALSEDADAMIKSIDAAKVNAVIAQRRDLLEGARQQFREHPGRAAGRGEPGHELNESSAKLDWRSATSTRSPRRSIPKRWPRSSPSAGEAGEFRRRRRRTPSGTTRPISTPRSGTPPRSPAKLNDLRGYKLDGLMASAQSFLGLAGDEERARTTRRRGAVGQEARRRRRCAGQGNLGRAHPLQRLGPQAVRGARHSGAEGA